MASERSSAGDHGFVEGKVLKGVQSIVMDKDFDRTLSRQQVRRLCNPSDDVRLIGRALLGTQGRIAVHNHSLHHRLMALTRR